MPVYTIEAPDGRRIKVEAADEATALKGAMEWAAQNPKQDAQSPAQALTPTQATAPTKDMGQQFMGSMEAGLAGAINGIPILGPLAQSATDWMGGGISALMGGDAGQYVKSREERRAQLASEYPISYIGSNIVSGIGTLGGVAAKVPAAAEMLGMPFAGSKAVPLGKQMLNSALSTEAIGIMDGVARGEMPMDAALQTAPWAAGAGLIPGVGAALGAVGRSGKRVFYDPVKSMLAPGNVAQRTVENSISADRAVGDALSSGDLRIADEAGIPIFNADRFGESTRRLARTATNAEPTAASFLSRAVDDRFKGQTSRAADFVTKLVGGKVDDLAFQEQLKTAADLANDPAYRKAFSSPNAQAVWDNDIAQLMQSPTFRKAVSEAEAVSNDSAAVANGRAVKNPFVLAEDGTYRLKTNSDGSTALPNLEFWNQVKINLQRAYEDSVSSPTRARAIQQLKNKLVENLDARVPEYKTARSGAALFFGTDNAVDAGRIAARTAGKVPEFTKAIGKMNQFEREAAQIGYASELLDGIRKSGDNRNLLLNSLFNTPDGRARNVLFLGEQNAAKLEAYARVEGLVDKLRTAVTGNSNTAQQLAAMGAFSVGGWALSGADISPNALLAAAVPWALKTMGKKGNEQVMRSIAEMLTSQDPKVLDKVIRNAALSQTHMEALRALEMALSAGAKGAVIGAATNQP